MTETRQERSSAPKTHWRKSADQIRPTIRARDGASDIILQGWTYRADAALPLHPLYRDGSYAEQMLVPTENVTRIGDITAEDAGGPVDMVLDFLPREASLTQVARQLDGRAPRRSHHADGRRPRRTGLDYNWLMHGEITMRGVWMYPPEAVPRMVQMVRAGLIDLHQFDLAEFALDDANAAVAYAASNAGPRQLTVIRAKDVSVG